MKVLLYRLAGAGSVYPFMLVANYHIATSLYHCPESQVFSATLWMSFVQGVCFLSAYDHIWRKFE